VGDCGGFEAFGYAWCCSPRRKAEKETEKEAAEEQEKAEKEAQKGSLSRLLESIWCAELVCLDCNEEIVYDDDSWEAHSYQT
jgi:hypothetical protein